MNEPKLTQIQHYQLSARRLADLKRAFVDIMGGPNPLMKWEMQALVKKRPEVYGFLAAWIKAMP